MKYYFLILGWMLGTGQLIVGQQISQDDGLLGKYQSKQDSSLTFILTKENNRFILDIVGQGSVEMTPLSSNTYRLDRVRPKASIQFFRDSLGKVRKFVWIQDIPPYQWIRSAKAFGTAQDSSLDRYTGEYQLVGNPYKVMKIRVENHHLTGQVSGEGKLDLFPVSQNRFQFKQDNLTLIIEFVPDKQGGFARLKTIRHGTLDCMKISDNDKDTLEKKLVSAPPGKFNRADSLQGMLTPLRSCYDVLFYDLNVAIQPEQKFIQGNTVIRFKVVQPFEKMQIDLFANMKIEKILFRNRPLSYTREFNAVFVQFPEVLRGGSMEEINIFYSGQPRPADFTRSTGGFIWLFNKQGKFWIETVCQGLGASLWWPCKDHLSDKPDSMKISVIIPRGLIDISNGRLQAKTELADNRTRFDWYVSYPINNYDVALNIGDYTHFSDVYVRHQDTLALEYYCMPDHEEIARQLFNHAKPMLALYEKDFGPYPFSRDGFTLLESLYPMEHQGAVSIGPINSPFQSNRVDSAELIRTMWHESAHEWWGNSITCKDNADIWIHEAFATYAELLNYETESGNRAVMDYLNRHRPENKKPVIGTYNVNDFSPGDAYSKGVWMLHTLRTITDNDSLWFGMLNGLTEHFKYQTVTTEEFVSYINTLLRKDYTEFFDQYLRYTAIPELRLKFIQEGHELSLQYRWVAHSDHFQMPIKVTTSRNHFEFIFPTTEWKLISLHTMNRKEFKVDMENFCITQGIE